MQPGQSASRKRRRKGQRVGSFQRGQQPLHPECDLRSVFLCFRTAPADIPLDHIDVTDDARFVLHLPDRFFAVGSQIGGKGLIS